MGDYLKNHLHVIILYIILALLVMTGIRQCSSIINLQDVSKHNIEALSDSVSYYRSKSDNIVAEKTILIGDMKMLKLANDSLYQVIRDMKLKQPDNVVYIETEIVHEKCDTVWVVNDNNFNKEFDFSDKYRILSGNIYKQDSLVGINIDKDIVYANYAVAIENGRAYITSNNPYIKVTDIQGIQLPKTKQKHWGIGPYVGVGITTEGQVRPVLGVGLTYSIISF